MVLNVPDNHFGLMHRLHLTPTKNNPRHFWATYKDNDDQKMIADRAIAIIQKAGLYYRWDMLEQKTPQQRANDELREFNKEFRGGELGNLIANQHKDYHSEMKKTFKPVELPNKYRYNRNRWLASRQK